MLHVLWMLRFERLQVYHKPLNWRLRICVIGTNFIGVGIVSDYR